LWPRYTKPFLLVFVRLERSMRGLLCGESCLLGVKLKCIC